jgi:predicted ATPase/DNA-binding SARP family transcriptional activator
MAQLILSFLGPLQITLGGEALTIFRSDKERALLAFLALEADRPHRREALIGLLWPEQPAALALNNLRKSLHRLRQTLRDQGATPPFLLITPKTIQFNPNSDYQLDVAEFSALLEACHQHTHRRLETCSVCNRRLQQAAQLYRRELLQGFFLADSVAFDEWVLVKREWLRWQALEVFYILNEFYTRRGEYTLAQRYVLRQLDIEPWRESAHRQLIRLWALRGERSAALAQYEACRRVLAEELGVEPEVETKALYQHIKGERFPYRITAPLPNLPTYLTPFIGREVEIEQLTARLLDPAYRLVTLVGEGGIGKTRLALAVVEQVWGDFLQGAWLVPLAGLTDSDLAVKEGERRPLHNNLSTAIANALGFTLFGKAEPRTQLLNYLREKELLLVLDDYEHLLAGADFILEILKAAPRVVILVTSREPLDFQAESIFRLDGLPAPLTASDPEAGAYSSVQLFADRAQRARGRFILDESTLPAVAQICQFLKGLPLGIELAAAWVRWRSPVEIVQALHKLDFLATTQRDVELRHRNMRTVFEGSWQWLSESARAMLAQASIFRGGFSEEAAQAVLEARPEDIWALVDKSLLRQSTTGRYEMHELLRQFAEEKLEAEGGRRRAVFRDRHLEYFLGLAEESQAKLKGAEQLTWLNRLEVEHDNFRTALEWSLCDHERNEKGLRLVSSLGWYWQLREYFIEGEQWLLRLLDTPQAEAVTASRAEALYFVGQLAWYQSKHAAALPFLQQSAQIWRTLGDEPHLAYATTLLAVVQLSQKQLTTGEALALLEQSLTWMRAAHDEWGLSFALNRCGLVALEARDYERARGYYQESLEIRRRLGNQHEISASLSNLGEVVRLQGDYKRAAELYEEAIVIAEQHGVVAYAAEARNNLGYTVYHLGDYERALNLFAKGIAQLQTLGIKQSMLAGLAGIGCVWAACGQVGEATRVFSVVDRELAYSGLSLVLTDRADYNAGVERVRACQSAAMFASAWARGRALSLPEALAYALGQVSQP